MRACPKCKSSEYNNKQFSLMINVCGHSLCRNCVESLFSRNSGPCPTCGKVLKKNAFWEQNFDDPAVEKEVYWRKKVGKVYNLKEDDFPSLNEYNDYLEEIEGIVWSLVQDVDVEATLAKMETFRNENADKIERSRNKKSKDELWIQDMIRQDAAYRQRVSGTLAEEEDWSMNRGIASGHAGTKRGKSAGLNQKKLISELMSSDLPADLLIAKKKAEKPQSDDLVEKKPPTVPSGHRNRNSLFFQPLTHHYDDSYGVHQNSTIELNGIEYVYEPVNVLSDGPNIPESEALSENGFLANVKESTPAQLSGGFTGSLACSRAIADAFCDLWLEV